MKVVPLGWRVLIHREKPDESTESGILLVSDTVTKEFAAETRGTIVAIGPKAWEDDEATKAIMNVGDQVIIRRYSGANVDGEQYSDILVQDQDVIAKIEA